MIVFAKKNKTSLWFLSQALTLIAEVREIYAEYLNTGLKKYKDALIVPRNFQICYCHLIDNNLMPEEYFNFLDFLISEHNNKLRKAINEKSEEVFILLAYFYQETKKLFFAELKRLNIILNLNVPDLDSKITEITEYEIESDPKTFIEDFKRNLALKE